MLAALTAAAAGGATTEKKVTLPVAAAAGKGTATSARGTNRSGAGTLKKTPLPSHAIPESAGSTSGKKSKAKKDTEQEEDYHAFLKLLEKKKALLSPNKSSPQHIYSPISAAGNLAGGAHAHKRYSPSRHHHHHSHCGPSTCDGGPLSPLPSSPFKPRGILPVPREEIKQDGKTHYVRECKIIEDWIGSLRSPTSTNDGSHPQPRSASPPRRHLTTR